MSRATLVACLIVAGILGGAIGYHDSPRPVPATVDPLPQPKEVITRTIVHTKTNTVIVTKTKQLPSICSALSDDADAITVQLGIESDAADELNSATEDLRAAAVTGDQRAEVALREKIAALTDTLENADIAAHEADAQLKDDTVNCKKGIK